MHDDLLKLIATDLDIVDLPPEEQKAIIEQFGEVALKAATIAVMATLAPEQQKEFMTLAEAGDPQALQRFFNEHVPNHAQIVKDAVAEEVKRFKEFNQA